MSAVLALLEAHPAWGVAFFAGLTALATGLGALPFYFMKGVSATAEAYSNALAGGLMLGATFGLVVEGGAHGRVETLGGALLGILFVLGSDRLLGEYEVRPSAVSEADLRKMILIVLVMTVHSFAEGVAVGASFAGGTAL
ncbi:MAG TPA: hypothetical protein VLL48_03520, partial [Longimicrobiales bacterium]|nr:hypothetical protein [Longimicrobiales bacterium]